MLNFSPGSIWHPRRPLLGVAPPPASRAPRPQHVPPLIGRRVPALTNRTRPSRHGDGRRVGPRGPDRTRAGTHGGEPVRPGRPDGPLERGRLPGGGTRASPTTPPRTRPASRNPLGTRGNRTCGPAAPASRPPTLSAGPSAPDSGPPLPSPRAPCVPLALPPSEEAPGRNTMFR